MDEAALCMRAHYGGRTVDEAALWRPHYARGRTMDDGCTMYEAAPVYEGALCRPPCV
jgi:hypothetical protein